MRQKGRPRLRFSRGFSPIIIILIIIPIIGVIFLFRPTEQTLPNTYPAVEKTVVTYKDDLQFFTEQEKELLFAAIDVSKTPKDFDWNVFKTWSDVLDTYNEKRVNDDQYFLAPEIMSDDPSGIFITSQGIQVDLLSGLGISSLTVDDMPTLKKFAKLFFEEMFRYPIIWSDIATPPFIVFVKKLDLGGEVVGGIEQGAVVYNISDVEIDEDYTRRIVHHELMHHIEQSTSTKSDTDWPLTLESYKQEYNFDSSYIYEEHPKAGFITGYAETNTMEDKAEIYAYLFTEYPKLMKFAKDDSLLQTKIDYLKSFIRKRVDKMNDEYFENYIAGQ